MKKYSLVLCALIGMTVALNADAIKHPAKQVKSIDPIAWSISPGTGFPATVNLGSSYAVSYTLSNNLPFAVPLSISTSYVGGTFTLTNGCNTTLAAKGSAGSSCLVHLSLLPVKVGKNTAQITMAYHKNRVPLPLLSSNAVSTETNEKISGQVTTPLPATTFTGNSYSVAFAFVNNGTAAVTATAVNVSGFTPTTNTCLAQLNPNSSPCTVSGTFTPTTLGQATLSVTYVYNAGSVPLSTQTNVQSGGGGCHHVSGTVPLPLPVNSFIYANNVVQYTFKNHCNTSTEQLGTVSITSDASTAPTLIVGTDNCSGTTLAANASCSVYVSVIPNATASEGNDLSVTASVPYNSNTQIANAATSEIVNPITNQGSLHTLYFVNQCSQNVWYGFKPSGTPDPTPSPTSWQSYQMNQQLSGAAPSTKTLQFSQYNGGSIFGRTNCDLVTTDAAYGTCATANCTSLGNSNGTCTVAPTQPFTVFEENLYSTPATDGVYDISLINGFNIPGEFRSMSPYVTVTPTSTFSNTCGNSAGAIIQPSDSALGKCLWSFTTPSTTPGTDCTSGTQTDNTANYYFVTAGSQDGCSSTVACPVSGEVCGMAWTTQPSSNPIYFGTPINQRCGTFQGYWTLANWTGFSATAQWGSNCNLYNHYAMGVTIDSVKPGSQPTYGFSTLNPDSSPLPSSILADMFACQPTSVLFCYTSPGTPHTCFNHPPNPYYSLNTGYNANDTNACGCHDWNNTATTPASAQTAQASQCLSTNTLWDTEVYARILWLKEACPTAYSYQFDDTSSQFTCNVSGQQTAYQISFCPGGKSGAPGT